jgi:hypothetical protein
MGLLPLLRGKSGVKCIRCYSIYGCIRNGEKLYCRSCPDRETCRYICVCDISGGLCASCYELKKLKKKEKDRGRKNI